MLSATGCSPQRADCPLPRLRLAPPAAGEQFTTSDVGPVPSSVVSVTRMTGPARANAIVWFLGCSASSTPFIESTAHVPINLA